MKIKIFLEITCHQFIIIFRNREMHEIAKYLYNFREHGWWGEIFRYSALRGMLKCLLVSNVVDSPRVVKSKLVLKVIAHFFNGVCT